MNYFKNCASVIEAAQLYKELIKVNHPLRGGNEFIFNAIVKQFTEFNEPEAEEAPKPKQEPKKIQKAQEIKELDEETKEAALKASELEGVKIEILGVWIWARGNTKDVKGDLKNIGFKWAKKKDDLSAWFYRSEANKVFKNRGKGLEIEEIKNKYKNNNYLLNL